MGRTREVEIFTAWDALRSWEVSSLYADILDQVPPDRQGPLSIVSQAVFEALVSKVLSQWRDDRATKLCASPHTL